MTEEQCVDTAVGQFEYLNPTGTVSQGKAELSHSRFEPVRSLSPMVIAVGDAGPASSGRTPTEKCGTKPTTFCQSGKFNVEKFVANLAI